MRGLRKLFNKDIAFQCKDWQGRDVFCDRGTARNHTFRFHLEAGLAVDRIKVNMPDPRWVVECRGAASENAIYALEVGDHPWLLVAIKSVLVQRTKFTIARVRLISTWYSFPENQLRAELAKGRLLWPKN